MSRIGYVLAVDIGTTRTKGIIVDDRANVVAHAFLTHSDRVPHPGWHEQDAVSVWWGEFVTIVRHLISTDGSLASNIQCICITGMFTCFCPTDERGVPLCSALLYDDARALEFAKQLDKPQNALLKGTELLARLMWLRETLPDMQSQLRMVFSTHSFIVYRLTGRYCIDGHTACGFGSVFERETFSWRKDELLRAHVDEAILPEALPPQTIAGYVTSVAARESGLKSGTPVLVGAGDMFESILSSGAHNPGDVMVHYGSGGALSQLTQDIAYLLTARKYVEGNEGVRWLMVLPRSGKQLEWFGSLFSVHQQVPHAHNQLQYLNASIDISQPARTQLLFLNDTGQPHEFIMTSPLLAAFLAIPLDSHISDFYRAMLEGFGYRIRQCAENAGLIGSPVNWYGVGGGGQNAKWCQIISDIVDHEQIVCSFGDSAFGGALMAGDAITLFDLQKVIEQRIEHASVYRPQAHLRQFYDKRYKQYIYAFQLLQDYREQWLSTI